VAAPLRGSPEAGRSEGAACFLVWEVAGEVTYLLEVAVPGRTLLAPAEGWREPGLVSAYFAG
jgi:hypothetical protein